jgi:hypothetical protein
MAKKAKDTESKKTKTIKKAKQAKSRPSPQVAAAPPEAVDALQPVAPQNNNEMSEEDRVNAARAVQTGFTTIADAFPSSEHAFSELAIHGAIAVLMDRAKRFKVPAMCVRCTADPNDPDCMLYVPDASGQLRPSHKIPKSEAGNYVPCGG